MDDGAGPKPRPAGLKVESSTADVVVGTWNNVAVGIWSDPTPESFRVFRRCQDGLFAEHSKGIFALSVIEAGAPMPSKDARKELAALVTAEKGRVLLSAIVHEGAGFRAAAIWAVASTMTLLAGPPFPQQVFSTIRDACRWLDGEAPTKKWRGTNLLEAIDATRKRGYPRFGK